MVSNLLQFRTVDFTNSSPNGFLRIIHDIHL